VTTVSADREVFVNSAAWASAAAPLELFSKITRTRAPDVMVGPRSVIRPVGRVVSRLMCPFSLSADG